MTGHVTSRRAYCPALTLHKLLSYLQYVLILYVDDGPYDTGRRLF